MFDKKNVMITELVSSEVIPNSSQISACCGLKGGNRVDGKEKKESSKEKNSEEKEALRPNAR